MDDASDLEGQSVPWTAHDQRGRVLTQPLAIQQNWARCRSSTWFRLSRLDPQRQYPDLRKALIDHGRTPARHIGAGELIVNSESRSRNRTSSVDQDEAATIRVLRVHGRARPCTEPAAPTPLLPDRLL